MFRVISNGLFLKRFIALVGDHFQQELADFSEELDSVKRDVFGDHVSTSIDPTTAFVADPNEYS